MNADLSRRALLQSGGALVVAFALPADLLAQAVAGGDAALGKSLDVEALDAYFAIHPDGAVTLYSGKVDLGTGLRIAFRQMLGEELGIGVDKISLIEGDTALTPNQGPTAGSTGIMRGGVQIRQAAATARRELIRLAAEKLNRPAEDLVAADGEIRPKAGGTGIGFGALIGGKKFDLKSDPKAPLKSPDAYTIVGKPLQRPDLPGKITGKHVYVHDFTLPGMLHGRVVRPPAVGAKLLEVDEASVAPFNAKIVRINDFLAVVAEDEWDALRARRALKARWSDAANLMGNSNVVEWMRAGPFESDEVVLKQGDAAGALAGAAKRISGTYYWPPQSHASMGPSCAVADVRADGATIWTASQATHRFQGVFAKIIGLPADKVRLIYLDGAGCYGMNGHDDAAADATLMSKALGRPVRVQWSREDELGWDPKGPPQHQEIDAGLTADGKIAAWRTQMWLPKATANLPNVPLVGPLAAGIAQTPGLSTGLISQNGHPSYPIAHADVTVHWLKDAPLRPSNIRAPGKIANNFAVESMVDELAALAGRDALEFRLQDLKDARGIEVLKRTAALLNWQARPAPAKSGQGRGIGYVHYKNSETYVAIAMEVSVDATRGAVQVKRVACAHDCGLVINPDAARAQIEGNILQTLSRALHEEVIFDRARVTSVDWASYPILTFPEVPQVLIELIDRPHEPPLGVGEAACTPVAAALANAIFDATGLRLRAVPFTPARVKAALSG